MCVCVCMCMCMCMCMCVYHSQDWRPPRPIPGLAVTGQFSPMQASCCDTCGQVPAAHRRAFDSCSRKSGKAASMRTSNFGFLKERPVSATGAVRAALRPLQPGAQDAVVGLGALLLVACLGLAREGARAALAPAPGLLLDPLGAGSSARAAALRALAPLSPFQLAVRGWCNQSDQLER